MDTIDDSYMELFKKRTEEEWKNKRIDPRIFGFQIQRGTRWNPGLTDSEIKKYESDLGVYFSRDFKTVLRNVNGTDLPTINVYGTSGGPPAFYPGVYTYPRDLKIVRERMKEIKKDWKEIKNVLKVFELSEEVALIPFYIHRCVVCDSQALGSPVVSVSDGDAIVYAPDIRTYLELEFG